jgi:hypothetical protein
MIFSNNSTPHNVDQNLTLIIKDFIKNHQNSFDKKNWNPSEESCKWCPFKVICPIKHKS